MKQKKVIMIVMLVMICVMAVGYAAFATNLTITGTSSIASTWKVVFTNIEEVSKTDGITINEVPTASGTSATFNVSLSSPGDSIVYKITVANQGTLDAIVDNITATENGSDAIKFEVTNIKKGDELAKSTTTTFNVTISYDESVTSQPTITANDLTIDITYIQDVGQSITSTTPAITATTLAGAVFKDNKIQSDASINFSEVGNGEGLYYTTTNTESNKITYYFRGNVTNNYVKLGTRTTNTCKYNGVDVAYLDMENFIFNSSPTQAECTSTNVCANSIGGHIVGVDEATCTEVGGTMTSSKATYTANVTEDILWRVVRVNEDGSIRLVTEKNMGSSAFNTNYNDNAYVGYMYGTVGATTYAATHANTNDSTIKDYLDDWYTDYLSSYASLISTEAGFCNDRSVSSKAGLWYSADTALGYGTNITYYGSYNRIEKLSQPQFACPQSSDLFTTSTSSKGNKELTNPIGLLTVDELIYAGGVAYQTNENYYLNNGTIYWTMSPHDFNGSFADVWCVGGDGRVSDGDVSVAVGVRPAVNLKSNVEITGGDGTIGTPYIIKVN